MFEFVFIFIFFLFDEMMLRQILLLLLFAFFFFTSTTIVNATLCNKYSRCLGFWDNYRGMLPPTRGVSVSCEDACLYYKCVTYGFKVYEGSGCFNDFIEKCGYISTKAIEEIVERIRTTRNTGLTYYDKSIIIAGCNEDYNTISRYNCSRKFFRRMLNETKNIYETFGEALFTLVRDKNDLEQCQSEGPPPRPKYDEQRGRYFAEKVQCSTRGWCELAKNYNPVYKGRAIAPYGVQMCDACVYYQCTGTGSEVMIGYGCYEDFDAICPVVPDEVKASIRKHIKSSFHFDSKYIVVTCSNEDECAPEEYRRFMAVHPFAELPVRRYDSQERDTCEFRPANEFDFPPPSEHLSSHGSFSLEINIWMMLFGVFFASFGFIF